MLVVKKDLFGQLKLPMAFTDGDEAEVSASVHNDAIDKGQIEVTLKTTIAGRSVEEKKTIDVKAKGIQELTFKTCCSNLARSSPKGRGAKSGEGTPSPRSSRRSSSLTVVAAGQQQDVVRRTRAAGALRHAGLRHGQRLGHQRHHGLGRAAQGHAARAARACRSSSARRSSGACWTSCSAPAPWCQIEVGRIASGLETATSDLMAVAGPAEAAGRHAARRAARRPRPSTAASAPASACLVSSQNDDGGWSWTGRGGNERPLRQRPGRLGAEPGPAGRLHRARRLLQQGARLPAEPGGGHRQQRLREQGDPAARPGGGRARATSPLANRLYRDRPSLSAAALAYLALAFARDGPQGHGRRVARPAGASGTSTTPRCSGASATGAAAVEPFAGRAPGPVCPGAPAGRAQVAQGQGAGRLAPGPSHGPSLVARQGHRPGRAGPVPLVRREPLRGRALQAGRVRQRRAGQGAGHRPRPPARSRSTCPPRCSKKDGKQRINFQITGRGRYTYQCILGGFVPADKLKSTTDRLEGRADLRAGAAGVGRPRDPARLRRAAGQLHRVPQSADATARGPPRAWSSCRSGGSNVPSNTPDEQLEYLVITEPIPSGATVIEKSVRGGVRAVRDLAGGDHLLRRQPPARRHDPLRVVRLPAGQVPRRRRRWSATPIGRSNWPSPTPKSLAVLPLGATVGRPVPAHAAGTLRAGQAAISTRAT